MKLKNLIKLSVLLILIFVKQTVVCGQTKSHLVANIHIQPTSVVKEITDGSQVGFIHNLPENQQFKNGVFTPGIFTFNEVTFTLNVNASSFTKNTEESYYMYRGLRIDGFQNNLEWFEFIESLKPIDGDDLEGVLWIENSGADKNGNVVFGNKKPLDRSWKFLGINGVPMFKITGGAGGPCLNLIRVTFVDGWTGKKPIKKPEPKDSVVEEPKEYLNLPCDNQKIEMGEYEVSNDTVYGRISKDGRYYYHYSDGVWYKNNNGNWDRIICPQTQVKTTSVVYQTPVWVTACDNLSYLKDGNTVDGYEMFNFGQIAFKNGEWFRKRPDGFFENLCEVKIANKKEQTETTETVYTCNHHQNCKGNCDQQNHNQNCTCNRCMNQQYFVQQRNQSYGGVVSVTIRPNREPILISNNNGNRNVREFNGTPSMSGNTLFPDFNGNPSTGGNSGNGTSSMGGGYQNGISEPIHRRP